MSVSSRLQCAVIAVAVLPCLATAQSGVLGNTPVSAPGTSYQAPAAPAEIAVNSAPVPRNAANGEATAIPAPNLETDPIPAQADKAPTSTVPADAQVAETSGPSLSSATAGFQSRSAQLTRQQNGRSCNGSRRRWSPRDRAGRRADDHWRRRDCCRRDCGRRRGHGADRRRSRDRCDGARVDLELTTT